MPRINVGIEGCSYLAETFPAYEAPQWLPSRIVANTPRIARESWIETLRLAWQWLIEPRTAMAVFTATLVLGWLGSLAGISPDWSAIVRNPSVVYYEGEAAVNRRMTEPFARIIGRRW